MIDQDDFVRLKVTGAVGTNQYVLDLCLDMVSLQYMEDPSGYIGRRVLDHINEVRAIQGKEEIAL